MVSMLFGVAWAQQPAALGDADPVAFVQADLFPTSPFESVSASDKVCTSRSADHDGLPFGRSSSGQIANQMQSGSPAAEAEQSVFTEGVTKLSHDTSDGVQHYLLDKKLGSGTFGEVWRATLDGESRKFALKIVAAEGPSKDCKLRIRKPGCRLPVAACNDALQADYYTRADDAGADDTQGARDARARDRNDEVCREVDAMKAVKGVEGCIQFEDRFDLDYHYVPQGTGVRSVNKIKLFVIVMELFGEGDLHKFRCLKNLLPPKDLLSIAVQVSRTLEAVHLKTKEHHPKGLIHRDIKPENLLFKRHESDGTLQIKICDWGVAGWATDKPSKVLCGSPAYAPPAITVKVKGEIHLPGELENNRDLASLAMTLATLHVGQLYLGQGRLDRRYPIYKKQAQHVLAKEQGHDRQAKARSDLFVAFIKQILVEKIDKETFVGQMSPTDALVWLAQKVEKGGELGLDPKTMGVLRSLPEPVPPRSGCCARLFS